MRHGMQHSEIPDPNSPTFYPPGLLEEAQQALSRLADLNFRYEGLMHRAEERARGQALHRLEERLKRRADRERQPAIRRLAAVHRRITELMFVDLRSAA